MPVRDDTLDYYRKLPHLGKADATYYVTFSTRKRLFLPEAARTLILDVVRNQYGSRCWIDIATVMPDHVHTIITPFERIALPTLLGRIKGASAYEANRLLSRRGPLWLEESFDRLLRRGDREKKFDYIATNPVRAGLVQRVEDYPWTWWPDDAESE